MGALLGHVVGSIRDFHSAGIIHANILEELRFLAPFNFKSTPEHSMMYMLWIYKKG